MIYRIVLILLFISSISNNTFCQQLAAALPKLSVTFFHPNKIEFDSLAELEYSEGLYEVDSDFAFYGNNVLDQYKDSLIEVRFSTIRYYNLDNFIIDKYKQRSIYGMILRKGDKFRIVNEVMPDAVIVMLIQDFFYGDESEAFNYFYEKFYSDSSFQKQRIIHPLEGYKLEWHETDDVTIKTEWDNTPIMHITSFEHVVKTYPNITRSLEIINDTIIEALGMDNSGFSLEKKYLLKNEKWFLSEYIISNL